MRQILILLLSLFFISTPSLADDKSEVSALLQGRIDTVVSLLKDKSLDKPSRNARIIEVVNPIFNYEAMAKLSLGKKHWPALSEDKKVEFSYLFIKRLQASYLDKLDIYTDEEISYGEPVIDGSKIHIPTTLVSPANKIEILYKFYRASDGWKIYDVEVGGVSVIQTYRSQFDDALTNGTIDELLDKLKNDGNFAVPAVKAKS